MSENMRVFVMGFGNVPLTPCYPGRFYMHCSADGYDYKEGGSGVFRRRVV
jgi:hypothetical protein